MKSTFNPEAISYQLQINSQKLNNRELLDLYVYQMKIAVRHSNKLSKNLILRDHSHSTFNFKNDKSFLLITISQNLIFRKMYS